MVQRPGGGSGSVKGWWMPCCMPCSRLWAGRTRTTRWVVQGWGRSALEGHSGVRLTSSYRELGRQQELGPGACELFGQHRKSRHAVWGSALGTGHPVVATLKWPCHEIPDRVLHAGCSPPFSFLSLCLGVLTPVGPLALASPSLHPQFLLCTLAVARLPGEG